MNLTTNEADLLINAIGVHQDYIKGEGAFQTYHSGANAYGLHPDRPVIKKLSIEQMRLLAQLEDVKIRLFKERSA